MSKRSLYELPGYAERGGYVYALLYSTGIVQVGRTADARAEVTARRKAARSLGVDLADWWVPVPHEEWIANERHLTETCLTLGGKRTGPGCYTGADFRMLTGKACDLPFTSTAGWAHGRRHRHREDPAGRDKRMAVAVRFRAQGLTVREIADRQSVSHTTIVKDLARWELVRDQMPLEIIRLSRPAGNPAWKPGPGNPSSSPACFPDPVSAEPDVIPFRRRA